MKGLSESPRAQIDEIPYDLKGKQDEGAVAGLRWRYLAETGLAGDLSGATG